MTTFKPSPCRHDNTFDESATDVAANLAGKVEYLGYLTSDFEYDLPVELIAQRPAEKRELSRLLVLDRGTGNIRHEIFTAIVEHLAPGDLLVANRSKVIPARLCATRPGGGQAELLLVRAHSTDRWRAMARPARRLRPGLVLDIAPGLTAVLECRTPDGDWDVKFRSDGDVTLALARAGRIPLPPYITDSGTPVERYQTIYGDHPGSIAAPTAGLHFSQTLIEELSRKDVSMEFVTLHVGPGTFRPVRTRKIAQHRMDPEWGEVPEHVAEAVNNTHAQHRKVVAIGTTTTRLLECSVRLGRVAAYSGEVDLFIHPGFQFQAIDALLTNFHLPRSTLLMLTCAFAGREHVLTAYREAIAQRYRFYSFGDAMLII